MHPATRILILVFVAGFLVTGSSFALAAGLVVSLALHWTAGLKPGAEFVRAVSRLRWLLLSILVLYAWFTPGAALLPAFAEYSPSIEGIVAGSFRCAVLIVILSLAHWLIQSTSREQLIQGIYWLIQPAKCLGLRPETLALRLALVLETAPRLQQKLELRPPAHNCASRARQIASYAAVVLDRVLIEAEREELLQIELATGQRLAAGDWLGLSALIAVLACLVLLPS